MKFLAVVLIGAMSWLGTATGAPEVLADFPINSMADRNAQSELPEGVSVEFDLEHSTDQGGAFKITYRGSDEVSVRLFEVPLADIDNTRIDYNAYLRAEGVTGKAYLEMLCLFPNGHEYFSRAAPWTPIGDHDWRPSNAPFFFAKGDKPVRATLGVRFEGPGTVWIDKVQLARACSGWRCWLDEPGALEGALSGGIGAVVGIWGGIIGVLSSRGRARRLVMSSITGIIVSGTILMVFGAYLCWAGADYARWYPTVLLGGLLIVVLGVIRPSIARRYQAVEAERMAARDESESL